MKVQQGDSAQPRVLAWERTRSQADGGVIWARQTLNRDLQECDRLILSFAVRVDHHSLPNSGWWSDEGGGSGEYPVKINIAFAATQGERFGWSRGFLYQHDRSTGLANYTLVPRSHWVTRQMDLLAPDQWVDERDKPLPQPAAITEILAGGNGWDFAGAIADLQLECQAPP